MLEPKTLQKSSKLIWISTITAMIVGVIGIAYWLLRRKKLTDEESLSHKQGYKFSLVNSEITGLSEKEAEALQSEGQDNAIQFKPQRSRREAIIQNTFSIFNLSLLGIALVQLFLGKPLDALLSLGVMIFNIALNTFQEFFARKRMEQFELATRLKATVIREGKTRSIDPGEIVPGDIVLVGPGDQLPVDGVIFGDGEILVDDSVLNIEGNQGMKGEGENIYAGSICLTGQAALQTTKVGSDRRIVGVLNEAELTKQELTPIQRIIDRVLRIMLVIVALLLLMVLSTNYRLDLGIPPEILIDVSSVIFSIAPAGLFFMILLTYAAGTADLAKIGALVRQARSVESLARVNVLCFAKGGVLTGTDVEIVPFLSSNEINYGEDIPESRIRQILGDFARSTSVPSPLTRALVKSFEGNPQPITEEAPYLNLYGWRAFKFEESNLRGVYVLGEPDVLKPYLAENLKLDSSDKEQESRGTAIKKSLARLGGIFRRSNKDFQTNESTETSNEQDKAMEAVNTENNLNEAGRRDEDTDTRGSKTRINEDEEEPRAGLFKRMLGGVNRVIRGDTDKDVAEMDMKDYDDTSVELIFAYYPEPLPIHNDFGAPYLSQGLVPLSRLRFSEKVRPEILETIKKFTQNEVCIKIFSSEPAERTAFILEQSGLDNLDHFIRGQISGNELTELTPSQMVHAARENNIFGELSPFQAAEIVSALRADEQFVAVIGDNVKDVPALRRADLAIAKQASSQAAMSQADIILLEDSPAALQRVLDKGQRIVTGLLDILKIYLAQVIYLALLILAVRIVSIGFPYSAAQGSAIAVFTLTIPAVGLTFWASSGVMNSTSLSRILRRFIIPAAITMSTAGMFVYRYFLGITNDMDYAHLTVTYTLVSVGLILVIFIKPPGRLWAGGASLTGDWRPTILVILLQIAFLISTRIPLAEEFLKIKPLNSPRDYLIIGLIVICWTITLRLAYWLWDFMNVLRQE